MKTRSQVLIDYIIAKNNFDALGDNFFIEEYSLEKDFLNLKIDEEIFLPIFRKYFSDETPIGFSYWGDDNSNIILVGIDLPTDQVYTKNNELYVAYNKEVSEMKAEAIK